MARSQTESSLFGAQLRAYRLAAGLSQEALAGMAGLSPNAIGALERGRGKRRTRIPSGGWRMPCR